MAKVGSFNYSAGPYQGNKFKKVVFVFSIYLYLEKKPVCLFLSEHRPQARHNQLAIHEYFLSFSY